ncbi:MAG: HI0074 family nucleotidyltransferase substrate-binding subunit [Candidatus Moranbacteria bacterium]|nr:HI0074 family nucleotidyltransferase substrate-binding subunit [Candidatus Moranbacteria bacterium]
MDYLKEKLEQLGKALKKLEEASEAEKTELNRDASIQRFEFTFELLWKCVKSYLKEIEKIDCHSPNSCIREARRLLELSEKEIETLLDMAEKINLSTHTYSEEQAEEIYQEIQKFLPLMKKTAERIRRNEEEVL